MTLNRKKLVIIGDGSCGKTSLLSSYINKVFDPDLKPTVLDTTTIKTEIQGSIVEFVIWDTAGQEEYERLRPLTYKNSDIILVCYSVENPESLTNIIEKWYPELRYFCPQTPVILVGNKKDLRDEFRESKVKKNVIKPLSTPDGEVMASRIRAHVFFECSSKTGEKVNDIFETAAIIVLMNNIMRKMLFVSLAFSLDLGDGQQEACLHLFKTAEIIGCHTTAKLALKKETILLCDKFYVSSENDTCELISKNLNASIDLIEKIVDSVSNSVGDFELEITDGLRQHNFYRKLHKVNELSYNETIGTEAQKWAEHLASTKQLAHNYQSPYGENIAQACGFAGFSVSIAASKWYEEIKNFNFTTGLRISKDLDIGHFTQLVWKGTTHVGFGKALDDQGCVYVVANYFPPGNIRGRYTTNVLDLE
ncbi:rho-related GTP-binding [Brachionus plicatilis]|uniref:Rho-related GTP-binding n=1 Tax=Brachionus plicatilis TaxID=10195 RepID=A0A3M7RS78_BRAPC|nr:rho-related GTP-binding [Brachionus plicatilis]